MNNHPNRNWRSKIPLANYIRDNYKSQSDFADTQKVKKQQVTQWIDKGFIVVDDKLYSPRRILNKNN